MPLLSRKGLSTSPQLITASHKLKMVSIKYPHKKLKVNIKHQHTVSCISHPNGIPSQLLLELFFINAIQSLSVFPFPINAGRLCSNECDVGILFPYPCKGRNECICRVSRKWASFRLGFSRPKSIILRSVGIMVGLYRLRKTRKSWYY